MKNARVSLPLGEFDDLRAEVETSRKLLTQINIDLNLVFQTSTEQLQARAQDLRDARSEQVARHILLGHPK